MKIVIEGERPLTEDTWRQILSQIDFLLERQAPFAHARLIGPKDKIRPRQEPVPAIEDLI